jgi:GWxTD domain-containing protein
MNLLQTFIASPLAGAIGWTLVYSLLEGAVISAALGAVLVGVRSPRARYAAACGAMLAMLACFVFTLARMMPERTEALLVLRPSAVAVRGAASVTDAPVVWQARLAMIVPWLAPFWIVGVLLIYAERIVGCFSARRLRRKGVCCASSHWQHEAARLSARLHISRPVKLLESCLTDVPMVLGHFRPLILMPVGMLAGIPQGQVEAVLLHELAHIRRCDYLANLLQRFVEGLFFYHPAVWWFSNVMRAERENCCDDVVVSTNGDAHEYAVALTTLEQNRLNGRIPAIAAIGGNPVKRIRRLLRPKPSGALAPFLAAGILIATAAVSLAAWKASLHQDQLSASESAAEKTLPPAYARWIKGPISYIITPQEKDVFLRLVTNEERDKFVKQFWERRNPNPGSLENVLKEEFYRRVTYADQHFAYPGVTGWKTDMGHLYIAWGPPNEIENHPKGTHGPHAVDDWYYNYIPRVGENVKIAFIDRTGSGDFRFALNVPLPALENSILAMPIVRGIYFKQSISMPAQTLYPTLWKRLEQIGLYGGESYNQKKGDEAKKVIQQAYMQRGIAVRVDEKVTAIPPVYVKLIFIISPR